MTAGPPAFAALPPQCLRDHRLFESRDLDDTRERISRVMQPHALRPNGGPARPAFMDYVRIGGIGVGAIGFGAPMRVQVDQLDGYHLLMFCLEGHGDTLADGRPVEVHGGRGVLSGPGRPFLANLSADCEQFVVRLDREAVHAHSGHGNLRFAPEVDLAAPALQPWLAQMRLVASSPALLRLVEDNALIATEMERLLVSLLLAGQPWQATGETPRRERVVSPACVRKAEAYMEAHVARPIRLADIAAAAGVPVRTLLDAFQRFRHGSPMQRLKDMRLEHAHARLLAGGNEVSVAGVALDCGFTHFGRFSESYRRRFSCLPSATLKRH
jgi:AraC-like DNA-binding protein